MAVKILKGEAKPEDMPIKHLSSKDLVVVKNDEMAEALGIDLSAAGRVAPCAAMCLGPILAPLPCYSISEPQGERQRPAFALLVTDETKHPAAALSCIVTAIMVTHVSTLS